MRKKIAPILGIATLLFTTTSCDLEFLGTEDTGTTTEVPDSNEDADVNPMHIRGYGNREPFPAGGRPAPAPSQYYAFSIEDMPPEIRQELDGKVAVEIVQTYYTPEKQLSDLAVKYGRQGVLSPVPASATDTAASPPTDTTGMEEGPRSTTVPVGSVPD